MSFVNKEFPGRHTKAVVHGERCDGCAFCVEVCPVSALEVLRNSERPGCRVVIVEERSCMGCGVCQATCPKEAISIPGLSPEEIRGYIADALDAPPRER